MALQVELIPTGEIIRVVHPHRPCKLVSWDALGWEDGGSVSPVPRSPLSSKLHGEEVSSGEAFWSLVGREGTGQEGVNGRKGDGFKPTRGRVFQSGDLGLTPFSSSSLILSGTGYDLG